VSALTGVLVRVIPQLLKGALEAMARMLRNVANVRRVLLPSELGACHLASLGNVLGPGAHLLPHRAKHALALGEARAVCSRVVVRLPVHLLHPKREHADHDDAEKIE